MYSNRQETILKLLNTIHAYPDDSEDQIHQKARVSGRRWFRFMFAIDLIDGDRDDGYRLTERGVKCKNTLEALTEMLSSSSSSEIQQK